MLLSRNVSPCGETDCTEESALGRVRLHTCVRTFGRLCGHPVRRRRATFRLHTTVIASRVGSLAAELASRQGVGAPSELYLTSQSGIRQRKGAPERSCRP